MIPVYTLERPVEIREAGGGDPQLDPGLLIPHRKGYYLFVLVRSGDSRHWVDARSYTAQPDHFNFAVPHQVRCKEDSRPMEGLILAFTQEFLQLEEHKALLGLPILQNEAGGHELRLTAEAVSLKRVFETNLFGPIRVVRHFLDLLKRSTLPRIINVTSDLASLTLHHDPNWV